jgi:phenylalanyl-tRNA synthetase beta chain
MLVSWNWLKDYVDLDVSHDELVERLSMSGLNHEESKPVGDDLQIDLEVTSNRPDCLGHIGVAREISVLNRTPLKTREPQPVESGPPISELTRVTIRCPNLCYRYSARVIRGAEIGPSPQWLVDRLSTIGVAAVNNVVDVTNYVMMECGQPLHAFDFAKLAGPEIIVREAIPGELFEAINHKTYELQAGTCVIADAQRSVALGGVMGGAETEISEQTKDLLIEAADFAPLSIRTTARSLVLHSPSSYRFERGVDPAGVDWASRRCCELILELAGGKLADGVIDVGRGAADCEPIVLRLSQLPRVLGIEIRQDEIRRILTALGCRETAADAQAVTVRPPTWRRDLTREIDLVEEVARIHGYDQIPEDVGVPMVPSHRSDEDRVLGKVRHVLLSAGFDEALTASVVSDQWSNAFSPWTDTEPICASTPMLKGADRLRRSLTPSLLEARRVNESLANPVIELFETARVYLSRDNDLPDEQWTLAITSGGDFYQLKGVIEAIVATLNPAARLESADTAQKLLDPTRSCSLTVDGKPLGWLGEVAQASLKRFGLRASTTIAELNLSVLAGLAQLIPKHCEQSPYPAIERDLNLIVDESVRWAALGETVEGAAGDCLESVSYQETYRDPKTDGAGKKRMLFSITLRSGERTLTNEEADQIRQQVVDACHQKHQAVLLGG